jgi:asparagine synthase (glutamine-hydrolysing)
MCGIAGVVSRDILRLEERDQVAQMSEALIHRGPDGHGRHDSDHLSLAMRRLSIIDLSGGWQPLYNEDRSLALVANGEIYNYVELRADLRAQGHVFSTGSDCEVILHLYEEYALDCVQHLRGMFVFALWDPGARRLVLARDRMGEKPLYLYERHGTLWFASELKALLRAGVVPFELDPSAILHYFHYQYVPEPMTAVRGVRKLPAAHLMTVTVDPWRMTERPYWRMEDAPPLEGDPPGIIRAELERVAELIVRADVPVGVALSGGVDSSAVAALAAMKYPGKLEAFSVGYEGRPHCDERAEAKAFADALKLPFHEVELRTQDMTASFPDVVESADDPIADISGYGYFRVMQAARAAKIPVMLQGQGGDELFWGYPWVRDALTQSRRKQELGAAGMLRPARYLRLRPPFDWSPRGLFNWVASFAGLRSSWRAMHRDRISPRDRLVFYDEGLPFRLVAPYIDAILAPEWKAKVSETDVCRLFTIRQPWPNLDVLFTRLICQTYLVENGMAQGDRLSMSSSVELRLPLVDYRLVETVIGLRKAQPDHGLPPKIWLKAALKGIVPDWVMNRPKRGFQPPTRTWAHALLSTYGHLLDGGYLVQAGVLQGDAARSLARPRFGMGPAAILAFEALALEVWCREQFSRKHGTIVNREWISCQPQMVGRC